MRYFAASLVLVVLAVAGPALAEDSVEAERLFRLGKNAEDRHDVRLAESWYRKSYAVKRTPATLSAIAFVQASDRRLPEAVCTYERVLEGEAGPPSEKVRRLVMEEIERFGGKVGHLAVEVRGPDLARVSLNDIDVGSTPLERPLCVWRDARYEVEIRAPGYLDEVHRVHIENAQHQVVTEMAISPSEQGFVWLESALPGATVWFDGRAVGETPLVRPIPAPLGPHRIELDRQGFRPAARELEVSEPGELIRVRIDPEPELVVPPDLAAELTVEVDEENPEVILDGHPFSNGTVVRGLHDLVVRRADFEPCHRDGLLLHAGDRLLLDVRPRPTDRYVEQHHNRYRRWRGGAWTTLGVALAILGTTTGLYAWSSDRNDDWEAEREFLSTEALHVGEPGHLSEPELLQRVDSNNDLARELDTWEGVEWGMLGLGIAAVATSIVLFFTGPERDRYAVFTENPGVGCQADAHLEPRGQP